MLRCETDLYLISAYDFALEGTSNRLGCASDQQLTEASVYANYDLSPIAFGRWRLILNMVNWSD